MNCESCKEKKNAGFYTEMIVGTMERTIRRLWILAILLIVLLVGSNVAWIWYESQWADIVVTQENADGFNNYIGNDGDIFNGEAND